MDAYLGAGGYFLQLFLRADFSAFHQLEGNQGKEDVEILLRADCGNPAFRHIAYHAYHVAARGRSQYNASEYGIAGRERVPALLYQCDLGKSDGNPD